MTAGLNSIPDVRGDRQNALPEASRAGLFYSINPVPGAFGMVPMLAMMMQLLQILTQILGQQEERIQRLEDKNRSGTNVQIIGNGNTVIINNEKPTDEYQEYEKIKDRSLLKPAPHHVQVRGDDNKVNVETAKKPVYREPAPLFRIALGGKVDLGPIHTSGAFDVHVGG